MERLASDDRSEPNSPFILIPIFFIIKRVLKKLTNINPPIAPSRDTGNGSNKAEMNPIAMYKLIHFRVYSNKCLLLLLEIPLITHHPVSFTYIIQQAVLKQMYTLQYQYFLIFTKLGVCSRFNDLNRRLLCLLLNT
jgi:hypothetical protein